MTEGGGNNLRENRRGRLRGQRATHMQLRHSTQQSHRWRQKSHHTRESEVFITVSFNVGVRKANTWIKEEKQHREEKRLKKKAINWVSALHQAHLPSAPVWQRKSGSRGQLRIPVREQTAAPPGCGFALAHQLQRLYPLKRRQMERPNKLIYSVNKKGPLAFRLSQTYSSENRKTEKHLGKNWISCLKLPFTDGAFAPLPKSHWFKWCV